MTSIGRIAFSKCSRKVVITNPIELGASIEDKTCVLDVKVEIDDEKVINIELQMWNQLYYISRSLYYWSKSYDTLKAGENYDKLKPTCHIGIIDFSLFPEEPQFYSKYRLQNVKTGREYTDFAPAELVKWAQIFKAKTMKDLEKLIKDDEVLKKMTFTIAKLSDDEKIRKQCEAREKYERDWNSAYIGGFANGEKSGIEKGLAQAQEVIDEKDKEIERLKAELAAKR